MAMSDARYDFGHAARLQADATGEPGQRRFRLLVDSPAGSACLWMEKEQLYGLALAIHRLLATLEETSEQTPAPSEGTGRPDQAPDVEFQVGNLALGHTPDTDLHALLVYDAEAPEDGSATLHCWANAQQLRDLADEALRVCAAGRPLCPLCHAPINPGEAHRCPKSNGHGQIDPPE